MTITEAIEDIEITFLQLEFAIKLLSYCELKKLDPSEFDTDHTVLLENGNLGFPTGHFSDPDNIIRAASVSVLLAFGASALALDKAYEVAGIAPDPSSEDKVTALRTLVYMVRCAYAHGIADPKWEVRGNYRRKMVVELASGPIELDLPKLHGQSFDFGQIGGHRNWFLIRDDMVTALRAMENDLKIDRSFISTWHPRYDEIANDEAEYGLLVDLTNKEIAEKGTLTKQTFIRILNWKSPRVKGIVKLSEFDAYEGGLRAAHTAEENKKLEVLCRLPGVGAPVGSTILHFMYPDSFPIIDVRTTETLHHAGRIERCSTDLSKYASFRSEMLNILRENSCFTLRQIDRALFAYHKIYLSRKQQCEANGKVAEMPRPGNMLTIRDKVLSVFQDKAGEEFGREEIIDLVATTYPGTKRSVIIPSDYCYNSLNKDAASFKLHLFESLGKGKFRCIGCNYPYSGPILWKGEQVGKWEHGRCRLWKDPRK